MADRWAKGDAYERYLGRWSARVARLFVPWLNRRAGARWLDVGCGTGALSRAILDADRCDDLVVAGVDPSFGFVAAAQRVTPDIRACFQVASGEDLPFAANTFDVVVSGLLLNFLPDPVRGVQEMTRVCRPGGQVAGYVWDYTGDMWMLRHFWEAVFELVPDARQRGEVQRFAACRPDLLRDLFGGAGLTNVEVTGLDAVAEFRDFDDYWAPFLAGQGAAPAYAASLPESVRADLAASLRQRLPVARDDSITLRLRVWAIRGRVN